MSRYCVLIIIRQLKSLKLLKKEKFFQTFAAGFVHSPYLAEKKARKYQRDLHLIIRLKLDNYW